ncbi:HTH lysR-type domain-containing protein, partial [Dysosmobacter welbionis]
PRCWAPQSTRATPCPSSWSCPTTASPPPKACGSCA